jgi:DNA uptake protein ComE-like DNA-binding protein
MIEHSLTYFCRSTYLKKDVGIKDKKLNIHTATLDELESMLSISRALAKEIIKLRVEQGILTISDLNAIKGFGPKTVSQAEQLFSFEPAV